MPRHCLKSMSYTVRKTYAQCHSRHLQCHKERAYLLSFLGFAHKIIGGTARRNHGKARENLELMPEIQYLNNMMKACALLSLALTVAGQASEIVVPSLEVNGKTYNQATVTYTTGATAKITHEAGSTNIPITRLPDEIKGQLGITDAVILKEKQRAAEAQASAEEKNKQAAERKKELAQATEIRVEVAAQHPEGLLVYHVEVFEAEDYIPPVVSSKAAAGGASGVGPARLTRIIEQTDKNRKYIITGLKVPDSYKPGTILKLKTIPNGTGKHGTETVTKYKALAISK